MSAQERELAARVVSALLREDYGGLSANVISTGDGCEQRVRLRLPGTGRTLPLEPDGYTADLRVPATAPLTLDEVQVAVATLAGTRDLEGAAAFATECRRTLDEARLRARHRPRPAGPLCYDALAAALPHPVYPASPCRLGLTDNDLLRYAPEFSPGFELRWTAIPKPVVTRSYSAEPAWWPTPDRVGLDRRISETHDLFPVHPLITRAAPVALAPWPYLTVQPTLSMRTVAVSGHPDQHLKLPLPASTLGLRNRRDLVPAALADGALAGQALAAVTAADPGLDGLLVADDTRYAHAGHRDVGYLLRRFPPGLDGAQVVPVAALTAMTSDGRTIFEDLAGPAGVQEFAREYFRLVLGIAVRLLVRHGIALESHQQNAALVIAPGAPLKLLVKDFDGTLVHSRRAAEIPGFTDPGRLTDDDDALADVFVTVTVHLCVGAIAFGLAEAGAAPLADLLGEARRALEEALEEEADAPAAKLLRVRVLEADRLAGESMVTAGSLTAGASGAGSENRRRNYGTTGPNYLRPAAGESDGATAGTANPFGR